MSVPGLFVVGTDTDVGKTHVATLILRDLVASGVRVGAYKPACSGATMSPDGDVSWTDVERLRGALGREIARERICPQRFQAPLAPPVAARLENRVIDRDLLRTGIDWWRDQADFLVVEGVGGLLCPVSDRDTIADLAADLQFPLIIVATMGLGTINHTLLTAEVALRRGLPVAGIVLNHPIPPRDGDAAQTNQVEIAARCSAPILGVLPHGPPVALLKHGLPIKMDWLTLGNDV